MLGISLEKIFQSVGMMKVTMTSMLCGCIANIILDPMLIFGIGFFPKLGMRGAAIATGAGQLLTLAIYIITYRVRQMPVNRPEAAKARRPYYRKNVLRRHSRYP